MNELQAATDRIRRGEFGGENLESVYGGDRDSQFSRICADQRLLYLAYLAEHPADDDVLLTVSYMEQVGFLDIGPRGGVPRMRIQFLIVYCLADRNRWTVNHVEVPEPKTRGDLRRLCAALGIPLTCQSDK